MPVTGTAHRRLIAATWNVHEGLPATGSGTPVNAETEKEVARLLSEKGVDIVAFQELGFAASGTSELLEHVRRTTDLKHVAAYPLHESSFFPERRSGVALASRFPVEHTRRCLLPNPRLQTRIEGKEIRSHDKGMLTAGFRPWGFDMEVTSLHSFPFYLFGREANESEFKEIWKHLAENLRHHVDGHSVLVCGDFNSSDRGLLLEVGNLPLTSSMEGSRTYNERSVDDILYGPRIILNRTEAIENFSDHRLCLSEFSVGS